MSHLYQWCQGYGSACILSRYSISVFITHPHSWGMYQYRYPDLAVWNEGNIDVILVIISWYNCTREEIVPCFPPVIVSLVVGLNGHVKMQSAWRSFSLKINTDTVETLMPCWLRSITHLVSGGGITFFVFFRVFSIIYTFFLHSPRPSCFFLSECARITVNVKFYI